MKRHTWTEGDDRALLEAVETCLPLAEHLEQQISEGGRKKERWWDMVAGRLAPAVLVTGDAARHRWTDLEREREAALAALEPLPKDPPDLPPTRWEMVAAQVDAYELTIGEATLETSTEILAIVSQLQRASTRHERMLRDLCREWGIPCVGDIIEFCDVEEEDD